MTPIFQSQFRLKTAFYCNLSHSFIKQLVKTNLFPNEQAVLRRALRVLFETYPKIKQQMLIRTYAAGEVSLGKAAELMGVSYEEMKEIIVESGTELHLGPLTVEELLEDAANA